jgi:hypothetical protein
VSRVRLSGDRLRYLRLWSHFTFDEHDLLYLVSIIALIFSTRALRAASSTRKSRRQAQPYRLGNKRASHSVIADLPEFFELQLEDRVVRRPRHDSGGLVLGLENIRKNNNNKEGQNEKIARLGHLAESFTTLSSGKQSKLPDLSVLPLIPYIRQKALNLRLHVRGQRQQRQAGGATEISV